MSNTSVALKDEKNRYEITVDGQLAGVLEYEHRNGAIDLVHTGVEDEYQGQGIAGILVKESLDQLRAIGKKVIPSCSYVKKFIDEHDEYQDMVA